MLDKNKMFLPEILEKEEHYYEVEKRWQKDNSNI